jgi:hypothetical protein
MPSLDVIYRLSESLGIEFFSLMDVAGYKTIHHSNQVELMKSQDLQDVMKDETYHWKGYYPTSEEREMIRTFMKALTGI